ncbi:hypothetical protein IQ215_04020 [Cyanobacterium stanieri LEGE 03274]|uniref:Uncharacterized protein n=1 Tax=Cyanobacterium stanieri LEGE 03274 TaxID=1828756 RepID=A0ABR9V3Y6_9CHRO|nr:hypothetical protein [Cyanobacterium stanieri]MBE9221856.1 hypothetical protein [Cyanobacterium stanieri LEGE 03274]
MDNQEVKYQDLQEKIALINEQITDLAQSCDGDCLKILHVLRELEATHRHVSDSFLNPALPTNRHRLYLLVRHMEEVGGWPYIPRMRLKSLCEKLLQEDEEE